MLYQLPTDPSIISNDPLGILDTENPPQVEVLSALIQTAIAGLTSGASPSDVLPALVEDIAYTIHGNGALDIGGLRRLLASGQYAVDRNAPTALLRAAQKLAECFPDHHLRTLDEENPRVSFTGFQVNSLLAHQFLGTLKQSKGTDWGLPDFTSWFASEPAHGAAVEGYLRTILGHFAEGGYAESEVFSFSFNNALAMPDPSESDSVPNVELEIVSEESEPSNISEVPFILVAAHSQPGPGATATQEERLQSASPALSISALVIPFIPNDAAVVTSAFPVHAAWRGHNREARMESLFLVTQRPRRHYILADALEMDGLEDEEAELKDLLHGRVEREAKKLSAAFSGAVKLLEDKRGGSACVIETGAWGCGAFGGSVLVKTVCMMIAAGLSGIDLRLSLLERREQDVRQVHALLQRHLTVSRLWTLITHSKTYADLLHGLSLADK